MMIITYRDIRLQLMDGVNMNKLPIPLCWRCRANRYIRRVANEAKQTRHWLPAAQLAASGFGLHTLSHTFIHPKPLTSFAASRSHDCPAVPDYYNKWNLFIYFCISDFVFFFAWMLFFWCYAESFFYLNFFASPIANSIGLVHCKFHCYLSVYVTV